MANITSSFTYLLPTEDYVSGVSTNRSGSYTYTGPENFPVQINELSGEVEKINVTVAPEGSLLKTINATDAAQLPMAYALSHQLIENYEYDYTYENETQSNGDVYSKPVTPDLRDVYEVRWDFGTSTWVFDQILKPLVNKYTDEAKSRKAKMETYRDSYDFGADLNTKIDHYIAGIGTYIENNPYHRTWKFVTLPDPVGTLPKMPIDVMQAISNVPMPTDSHLNFPGG